MPTSKIFLPDVNVWLALASWRHPHAEVSSAWLESIRSDLVAFCRVTQMGLLRLLTNTSVMGDDVLTSRAAWRTYEIILSDERISFAPEPFSIEPDWKKMTNQNRPNSKVWTNAYLAAFAQTTGMQVVTLDRGMLALTRNALLLQKD